VDTRKSSNADITSVAPDQRGICCLPTGRPFPVRFPSQGGCQIRKTRLNVNPDRFLWCTNNPILFAKKSRRRCVAPWQPLVSS